MLDINYANANTVIRIKEKELLTKEQFNALLKATSFEQIIQLLKTTTYADLNSNYNKQLMMHLEKTYALLFDLTPNSNIIELFSLIYTYHNLKVLLKRKLAHINISDSYITIGLYNKEQLSHFIDTIQITDDNKYNFPTLLVQAVIDVLTYYADYSSVESIDILMDRAYFNHIYFIASQQNDDRLLQLIRIWIDSYNVSVVLRSAKFKLNRSFLLSILVENGEIPLKQLVDVSLKQHSKEIYVLFKDTSYYQHVERFFINNSSLDHFKDYMTHLYCDDARFEVFGFKPLFAYLFYKEMEIKNIQLLLTGKDNDINENILSERMKPIYDI